MSYRHPVQPDTVFVYDDVAGTGVAVAGLPHAPHIDDVPSVLPKVVSPPLGYHFSGGKTLL